MNLTDLLFLPLFLLTLITLLLLVVLGATVVFPRKWEATLREAALAEVERRFVGLGPRSQADLIAAERLVGNGSGPADTEDDTASAVLDAVLVLTNGSDRSPATSGRRAALKEPQRSRSGSSGARLAFRTDRPEQHSLPPRHAVYPGMTLGMSRGAGGSGPCRSDARSPSITSAA